MKSESMLNTTSKGKREGHGDGPEGSCSLDFEELRLPLQRYLNPYTSSEYKQAHCPHYQSFADYCDVFLAHSQPFVVTRFHGTLFDSQMSPTHGSQELQSYSKTPRSHSITIVQHMCLLPSRAYSLFPQEIMPFSHTHISEQTTGRVYREAANSSIQTRFPIRR
jgi:hypothetical protein